VLLGKVVGLEMLYNFGLYRFFLPPAVTMGRNNGLLQRARYNLLQPFVMLLYEFPQDFHQCCYNIRRMIRTGSWDTFGICQTFIFLLQL